MPNHPRDCRSGSPKWQAMPMLAYMRLVVCVFLVGIGFPFGGSQLPAEEALGLTELPSGTVISDVPPAPWTHTVFLSIPKVRNGDVNQVSSTVIDLAEMLSMVVLARIEESATTDQRRFALVDVGIGLAVRRGQKYIVVNGETDDNVDQSLHKQSVALNFLQNQVAQSASKSLKEIKVVARRTTLLMYDAPAVFRLDDQNTQHILRSLIWVDSTTGKLGKLVWLLDKDQPVTSLDEARYLSPPFIEQRSLYVDASEFSFIGMPSKQAFALIQLPQGARVPLNGDLAKLAAKTTYDVEQLGRLVADLSKATRASATDQQK